MSHRRSTNADSLNLYIRFFEYARVETEVVVTDEGVYLKDEVPEDYGGAQLELKVCNAVFMVNAKGELQILEFEMQPVMDKDRKTGGPITRDGKPLREATGDSTTAVPQKTVVNAALDDDRKLLGQQSFASFTTAVAGVAGQIIS